MIGGRLQLSRLLIDDMITRLGVIVFFPSSEPPYEFRVVKGIEFHGSFPRIQGFPEWNFFGRGLVFGRQSDSSETVMRSVLLLVSCEKIQPKLNRSPLNSSSLGLGTEVDSHASEGFNLFWLNGKVSLAG